MIFKQETVKSWFTGINTSINNEIVQPFKNAEQVIWKYNQSIQNNSLTQQGWIRLLAQSDDGLKAYLTSIKGSTASMAGYNVTLQGNITGFSKVSSAIKQYNTFAMAGIKEQNAFATAVSTTNGKLGTYLTGLNGAKASLSGYGISLITSTAKTIGLTVATTALNATLTMGISLIVSGIISAFTAWIHKSEEITEAAQEAADKISSINDSLKTNIETVENAKKRYAELAQEVENLGKISQSQGTLSNEEYEEFLDLSNQLADIFPSLTKNYDDNGNAILNLSGDVNTIVGSLDNLIQKEKELANQKIMEEFPDVFKGWIQDLSDAEQKAKNAQKEFDKINQAYSSLEKGQSVQMGFETTGYSSEGISMGQYESWLKDLGLTYEETVVTGGKVVTAIGDIDTAFTSKLESAREELKYAQQQLEGQTSSINQDLSTWLQTEFSYNQIEDSGLQTAIQDMLFNFDWSSLPEKIDKSDWYDVSEYLRRNILFAINNVQDNDEISAALSEIFTNTELTPDEKASYLKQIQDYFGEDNIISISLKPQIDNAETLQKQYQNAIDFAKDKFGGYDPTAFFKEHSINTQEEIDAWQEIAQGARDAVEAEKEYIQGSTLNEIPLSFSEQFKSLWDSETFSDAKEDLTKLAKESKITEADIRSLARENSELASLLNESGISAQFAAACFNRVSDSADGFSAITDDALALDKALHEMDESLQNVAASKSVYDKAMEQDDYNAEFKDYQEAYEQAMEMFENGEYGKHFQSSMLYLLGDDAVNMSIEEMKNAMDKLKSVFGENATNGLEFLDKLYGKKDILDNMSSSLEKLSDGSYEFDLEPEEFEQIGEALGMTTEEVAACTNALGMFGDYASYDIEKVQDALQGMSIAVKDGEDSILSLQSVKDMLSNMGYDEWDIAKIMQDIQGMGNIKLIDFSASDAESIKSAVSYLQQLEMVEIDGSNINVDSLIEHLRDELGMVPEEINAFLTNLDKDYDFSDLEGNVISLDKAFEKVEEQDTKSVTGEIEETDEAIQDATESADGLYETLDDISHLSLESLRSQVIGVKEAINEVMGAADAAGSVLGNLSGNVNFTSDGKNSGNETTKGTLNKGKATAAGNFNIKKTGAAKATGDIGAKKTEDVLLNELGNETVIDPESGTYEIVQGGAQFQKIKKGQIILNHLQTKALLEKGKISSFGKMMFGGNALLKGRAYALGTAGGTNPATGKTYSGNSSKSSSSSTSNTSSTSNDEKEQTALEKFQDWISRLFDWIEIKISRQSDRIDKYIERAEAASDSAHYKKAVRSYKKAASATVKQITYEEAAAQKYAGFADSILNNAVAMGLLSSGQTDSIRRDMANGTLDISEYGEELQEVIKDYQEWYDICPSI